MGGAGNVSAAAGLALGMSHTNDPAVIKRLLTEKGRWAVAGLSSNSARTAYGIAAYVRDLGHCLLYTSPSPRDKRQSRMPSSA